MSVTSDLPADSDRQDSQHAATVMDDSGSSAASPKASPKSILRKRTADGDEARKLESKKIAFADKLGGDLAGALVPEKTRSRDDWLWSVNRRRCANMIDLFRAQESAGKSFEDVASGVDKYKEGVWDVVLFKAVESSDEESSDDDENSDVEGDDYEEEEEIVEEMVDAEGLEIVFEAWIDEDSDDRPLAGEGNDDEEMDDSSDDDDDDDDDDDQDDEDSEIEDGDDFTITPSSSPGCEKSLSLEPH
ncbi:hypothetical protein F5Y05DRAFT_5141 [Hypoxylon sp. FL0543]|nr:hypothetical protein F5Y05DRAFT_5141 [Hypoxylon sp. FL0543]